MFVLKKLTYGERKLGRRTPLLRNLAYLPKFRCNLKTQTSALDLSPIFVSKPSDDRPYIEISLYGVKLPALLDSGASHSVIGKPAMWILNMFKLKLDKKINKTVTTADGNQQRITASFDIPIRIGNACEVINFYIVPSLEHGIILGSNFCQQFKLLIDYNKRSWDIQVGNTHVNTISVGNSNGTPKQNVAVSKNLTKRLSAEQLREAEAIAMSFKQIAGDENKLGLTNKLKHHINTGDALPFKQRQYMMSPYMQSHLNTELDKMLAQGVIEPSHGAWSSAVLLVKKSNGDYRFCFDGRKLNSVTKPDRYPLPRVDRILSMLRNAKFISSIDLRSAFWQIPLDEESKEKTGFSIPGRGMFQFKVMPFGLSCSAQTLQRLMDALFGPELEPHVFCYLDDIIVISGSFDEHVRLLNTVRDRLREANLTVNLSKCEFFKASLKYLGYVVDGDGLRTDPEKVSAMVNYPRPTTATEVKRFLGMCSWYRRFISQFSTLVAPLNDLLKGKQKKQVINWNNDAEDSFLKIKQALVSAPVLRSPDFSKVFTIQCDASDVGLGGVLTQELEGEEVAIAFCSRSLSRAERNYSVTQRELLSLLFCIEKFRPYVEGTKFRVITDHYSLLWLNRLKEPTGKLARWAVKLQQYSFELCHRKGKLNVVPDALSRIPVEEINVLKINDCKLDNWYINLRNNIKAFPTKYPQWKVLHDQVYKFIPSKTPITSNNLEWKMLVPKILRREVISSCHDPPNCAHGGFFKTFNRVRDEHYWPNMRRDIYNYIRNCKVCGQQKVDSKPRMGVMGSEKQVKYPWQIIAVDIMGPFPKSSSGNMYLLVVSDWFSKFTLLYPMRRAVASTIVRFMENQVFLVFGVPQFIICDNGTVFAGSEFKKLANKYKVQKIWFNARYHPQCNFVERVNRTVGTAIRSYISNNHKKWDEHLYHIQRAINSARHEVTGYTPSFLNFGRNVPLSGNYYGEISSTEGHELLASNRDDFVADIKGISEVYKQVQEQLHKAYERNKKFYDLRKRDVTFCEGERVWRRNKVLSDASRYLSSKLSPKYVLNKVRKRLSRVVYNLENLDGSDAGNWHVKDMKQYLGSNSDVSVG